MPVDDEKWSLNQGKVSLVTFLLHFIFDTAVIQRMHKTEESYMKAGGVKRGNICANKEFSDNIMHVQFISGVNTNSYF